MKPKALNQISLNQVGSFFNFPNWRYLIYLEPQRANLAYCRDKPIDGSNRLRRYLASNKELLDGISSTYSFTPFISEAISNFSLEEKNMFFKLFNKKLKKQGDKKLFIPTYKSDDVKIWSCKFIDLIIDEPLRNFLHHIARVKYFSEYDFAVKFHSSKDHQRTCCVIGYCIFAGLSDTEIAKRYKLYPKQIRALRELFFDFTNTPTEVVARSAYFTQLADNQVISDVDRRYYKIIGSLGELGLKADADPHSLTFDERERLNAYLGDSMIDNVTSLYFSIEDKKDALNYNSVINNLASFLIKKEEIKYFQAKVRNLDASTTRILNDKVDFDSATQEEDEIALQMISQLALKENALPEYKSITELK
jgi:hypothetical protein